MSYRDDREGVTGDVEPPKLLDQVRQRLRVKHYSLRTEQAYVGWIRRFILANGKRHPREMGEREVEAFLTVLATKGRSEERCVGKECVSTCRSLRSQFH